MDSTQVALSWGLFGAAVVGCCYYYWPTQPLKAERRREDPDAGRGRKREQDGRHRADKRSSEPNLGATSAADSGPHSGTAPTRKRKVQTKEAEPTEETPAVVVHADEAEEIDTSTRAFAERLAQTQKGTDLSTKKGKESRAKTVKQSSAMNTPILSSGSSQADADDDLSPAVSPALHAGGIADMLEPTASGPSTLRLTAPSKPQKERAPKQAKQEDVETKKQRQNRQKVEERRLQREAEERERKVLEERQRRTAREARGEPARNGIPVSKPPASNAWAASTPKPVNGNITTRVANETSNAPLLDTFDAESTSSSNGGPAMSTAATSTTSAGATQHDRDFQSEEDQLAEAVRQSEDESGWTTVAQPKKQKKKNSTEETASEKPVLATKTNGSASKPLVNGKPKGFQALEVEYEQRGDADPSDASNWDA